MLMCTFHRTLSHDIHFSHIHISLRGKDGQNGFALAEADRKNGRANATYEDTRWISQEAEWFLAGLLGGLMDSKLATIYVLTTNLTDYE